MIDINSTKFLSLSKESKLLILAAIFEEREITFSKFFCQLIDLEYPDDSFVFHQKLKEIADKKIDYKNPKLKFSKPTVDEIEKFLFLIRNKLKKSFNLEQIKFFSNYFYNFYENKNWKIGQKKMVDWKKHLVYAVNNWDVKYPTIVSGSSIQDEINKAFG
jgi:hypothetical protein